MPRGSRTRWRATGRSPRCSAGSTRGSRRPVLSLVLFAGIAPILILLPGDVNFVGTLYSFGATLSFTVAHFSLVRLRMKQKGSTETFYRARPNLLLRGDRMAPVRHRRRARHGCLVPRHRRAESDHAVGRSRLDRLRAGVLRRLPPAVREGVARRHREGAARVRAGARARVPAPARSRSSRGSRRTTRSTWPAASPRSAAPGSWRSTCSRCRSTGRSTTTWESSRTPPTTELDEAIAIGDSYGIKVLDRLVRARSAGQAIVEEAEQRGTEIIVLGTPRKTLTATQRAVFGRTVDYVLRHAPCRVMVTALARRGARRDLVPAGDPRLLRLLRPDRACAARRHGP